ncbi:MAG: hypothetical protein ACI86C_001242 [Candidatus Latescibacterota bacterium]|jgi:hypothetical protein
MRSGSILIVYNSIEQQVYGPKELNSGDTVLNLDMSSGIYYLKLQANRTQLIKKLIVE